MAKGDGEWKPVANDLDLLVCGYSFGPGHAYSLAVPCDGGFAVVSAPCNAVESTYADLEKRGKVRALIAPNAYHTMGLAPWKARFPEAALFAPTQAIPRVEKKGRVTGVKPVSEAASITGSELELIDMPHYKTGEVLVRTRQGQRVAWYVTDVIMNMRVTPPNFPIKQIFEWTKSAPGLRPNGIAPLFMMKDKSSVYRWLRSEIDEAPPTTLVPAHGDVILDGAADRLRQVLPS